MASSTFSNKARCDVRMLAAVALLSLLVGCFRDLDVGKITCNQPKGCPEGSVCAVSGKCCKSTNGVSCDAFDAGSSEVQIGIDASALDGERGVDVQVADSPNVTLAEAGDRPAVDMEASSSLDAQMADAGSYGEGLA